MEQAGAGRFAPSPSGDLHLGNLRTALLAWLAARSSGRSFLVRMEDLDRDRTVPGAAERQLADLAALGLDWDGPVVFQSQRLGLYDGAVARLAEAGLTYPCFCTRREIREAASAPQAAGAGELVAPEGAYPGTCWGLSAAERQDRIASGRPPAIRLRADLAVETIRDALHAEVTGVVDDLVLVRGDGTPAYNLAVVVDDADQGIDQVVRGDDLLASAPRQAHLARLLGLPIPAYGHVPLALNRAGQRLAKRDGAVTLAELAALGVGAEEVLARLAVSCGLARAGERVAAADLIDRFAWSRLVKEPWVVDPA
ncbi:MAG: tRNA glutamyl-Q(34) synthetase GluQRS [Nocardioides sp.]